MINNHSLKQTSNQQDGECQTQDPLKRQRNPVVVSSSIVGSMLQLEKRNNFKAQISQQRYPHVHEKYNINQTDRREDSRQDIFYRKRCLANVINKSNQPHSANDTKINPADRWWTAHSFSPRRSQNSAGTNTGDNDQVDLIQFQTLFPLDQALNQDLPELKKAFDELEVKDDIQILEHPFISQRKSKNNPRKQETMPSPELKKFSTLVSLESLKKNPDFQDENNLVQCDDLIQKSHHVFQAMMVEKSFDAVQKDSSETLKIQAIEKHRVQVKLNSTYPLDCIEKAGTEKTEKPKYLKQKQPRANFTSLIPNEVPAESLFHSSSSTPMAAGASKFQQRQIQRLGRLPCSYRKYKLPVLTQPETQVIVVPPIRQREILIQSFDQLGKLRLSQRQLMTRQQHERGSIKFKSLNQQKIEQHYRNIECAQGQDLMFLSNDRLVRAEQQRKLLSNNRQKQSHL